jgi:hypothetical protein
MKHVTKQFGTSLILAALLAACATTHPGTIGETVGEGPKLPLRVSAQAVGDPAGESFQMFEVTLENTSDVWLKINRAHVVTPDDPNAKVSVVVGKDLEDWVSAMNERRRQQEYNKSIAKGALLASGILVAAIGKHNNNSAAELAGEVAALGGASWMLADALNTDYRWATSPTKVPSTHLHNSYSIPGKMFLRRWVLLNKPPNARITNLVIEFEAVDGTKSTYAVSL